MLFSACGGSERAGSGSSEYQGNVGVTLEAGEAFPRLDAMRRVMRKIEREPDNNQ